MKKFSIIILVLISFTVFSLPVLASTTTSPGIKPGNFFYFFDTAFEKIGLFFTFNPEKKAKKVLEHANERLAEKEAIAQVIEASKKDQASPATQNCIKSIMNNISEKMKSGEFKGISDIPAIVKDCLPQGTKIPSNEEMMGLLKKTEEFYGKSLSPKDLESLKKVEEYYGKNLSPEKTEIPSSGKSLNLEDIKNIQKKMEEELKKIPPEELEQIKKMQEQGQFENVTQPEIRSSGSGMGL